MPLAVVFLNWMFSVRYDVVIFAPDERYTGVLKLSTNSASGETPVCAFSGEYVTASSSDVVNETYSFATLLPPEYLSAPCVITR